jgi:hypothetical protein
MIMVACLIFGMHRIVFDIDDFVTHFSDKSIYICDKDFVTKSTLKAINKKARQWRRAGAQYIILY